MNLLETWDRLSKWPLGKCLFNFWLCRQVPYTGTIRPEILEFRSGFVRVQMKDRRCVRNHLNSVHAIALMNLGEISSGLAVVGGLPSSIRSIVTRLEIDYLKKARGTLIASSQFELPKTGIQQRTPVVAEAILKNMAGETVAKVTAHWLLEPKPSQIQ